MQATRIQLCGRITVELDGRRLEAELPGRQGRLLFVYLALNRARALTRDELAAAIWPEEAPARADSNLRVVVSRLRKALGPEALAGRADLRLVLPGDAWLDIEVAARKIHEAEAAAHADDWSRALPAATIAYAISGRGFLSGEDAPWVVEQRHWLDDVHLRALECDAAASLGIGGSEVAAAERDARRLIRLAPYRESGYRLLMQALACRDNNAEALLVYEQLRTVLRDELGATPSPATRALHRRILGEAG
ncbi:MAG TPA: BTAD domain-containing putative transcriptional regulator [Solirubrobacteraceae bacterium]|nr:BTAD domain-containing putative transcriptional regulator [Solirubrobacteraceae bacterium]